MRIKSYFANRVHDALAAAQSELGPNAVLLGSHKTVGEARSLGVFEVVCGLADNDQPERAGRGLACSVSSKKSLMPPEGSVDRSLPASATRIRKVDSFESPAFGEGSSFDIALQNWVDLMSFLVTSGFPATLARDLARETCALIHGRNVELGEPLETNGRGAEPKFKSAAGASRGVVAAFAALHAGADLEARPLPDSVETRGQWFQKLPPLGILRAALLKAISGRMSRNALCARSPVPDSRVLVLVGPPGSGKTSTCAKVAASTAISVNRPVRLIGISANVPGAVARLGALASAMGLPGEEVCSPDQLLTATRPVDSDELLIVDCPGFPSREMGERRRWAEAIRMAGLEDVNLVVPAHVRPAQLFEAASRYRMFEPRSLTFTHVDATDDLTPCLALAVSMQLPVRYLCDGQEIPDDLAVPSSVEIAEQLLPQRTARAHWN